MFVTYDEVTYVKIIFKIFCIKQIKFILKYDMRLSFSILSMFYFPTAIMDFHKF